MAYANPLLSSEPTESCETISPYPFKPYNLTSLDTASSSPHHFTSLSFFLPPNKLPHALNRLEGAILRLISHYPFLTGSVNARSGEPTSSPGPRPNGQSGDIFEIQPVTASLMQHIPMLQTQHHTVPSALSPSDHLPRTFLPFHISSPTEQSPALRCKANVLGTRLVLVFGWDTRVMDPGGVYAVVRALAEFCRDPGALREEMPVSDPWAQAREQGEIASEDALGGLARCTLRHWNGGMRSWQSMMPSASDVTAQPETRTAQLNGDKVAMLTDACNLLVARVAPDACPRRLDQEDVVSAVVGICGSRARDHSAAAAHTDRGTVAVSADLRQLSSLSTPATYMGNATVSIPVPVQPNSLPALDDAQMQSLLPDISPRDLYRICSLAASLQGRINAMEKGDDTNMTWNAEGWGMSPENRMRIHTLRPMDFYMDFGPLGGVHDVNVPSARENGTCWVLPEKERGGGWDVAVTVEREAMQKLRADRFMRWIVDGVGF
ncbi:hypothetical protein P170DRAFT_469622 [Aspergillus steynii IBT 23096]|uniref:Transferase family protein n=1 Tax=Aspergillus steynii IBT 23096 TaxID=1392250 RepID=A0A2I2GMN4_9EURO|nr:uncharacterized protein P170DRAFT_469622 [Aspergillus steynii IBT 23096]PLB54158.1 hypothetical protein P170DRAFT_469622 [Aspergillus steynii IBT 23096]